MSACPHLFPGLVCPTLSLMFMGRGKHSGIIPHVINVSMSIKISPPSSATTMALTFLVVFISLKQMYMWHCPTKLDAEFHTGNSHVAWFVLVCRNNLELVSDGHCVFSKHERRSWSSTLIFLNLPWYGSASPTRRFLKLTALVCWSESENSNFKIKYSSFSNSEEFLVLKSAKSVSPFTKKYDNN